MWRPGDPKPPGRTAHQPAAQGPKEESQSTVRSPAPARPTSSEAGETKNLSSSTLKMKFMQRRAAQDGQAGESKAQAQAERAAMWQLDGQGAEAGPTKQSSRSARRGELAQLRRPEFATEETDPRLQWVGRQSFGGFNPVVQAMWEQNAEEIGLIKKRKRQQVAEEIDDRTMAERFEEQGSAPPKVRKGRYTSYGNQGDRQDSAARDTKRGSVQKEGRKSI